MAEIFVFGSNLLGIHKKGAALTALQKHGAILGQGVGLQGNSYLSLYLVIFSETSHNM